MTVSDLIERLEKSEGASRELDDAIHTIIDPPRPGVIRFGNTPAYTASVDAAIALAERVLPGWKWEITTSGFRPGANIFRQTNDLNGAHAATPALAACICILRALQAKEAQP